MLKNVCQESLPACKYLENKDHITGIFNPQGLPSTAAFHESASQDRASKSEFPGQQTPWGLDGNNKFHVP